MKAELILENGAAVKGEGAGAPGKVSGEIVIADTMTGYEDVLSDPAYEGKIVLLTFPAAGNVGITGDPSARPKPAALIVREVCDYPSNYLCQCSLGEYFRMHSFPVICGIDTRALAKKIRDAGNLMKGTLTVTD